ncbi:MAG: hypothetical protein HY721_10750 [Planctomycetes bacterium]|nr:hypothetical protein [Planctomycetota bacterium]
MLLADDGLYPNGEDPANPKCEAVLALLLGPWVPDLARERHLEGEAVDVLWEAGRVAAPRRAGAIEGALEDSPRAVWAA